MPNDERITGDLTASASGSRITGFYGTTTQERARGYSGGRARGVPGVPDPVAPVVANFSALVLSGAAPLTVSFLNLSENATSYLWAFGDGATSTESNPTHVYEGGGTYNVTLTATGTGGATNVLTRVGYINVTGAFTWIIDDGQVLNTYADTSTYIATGASGLTTRIDPDLPPGHSLVLSGGALSIDAASDAPSYTDVDRSALDVGDPWRITVMDSPLAEAWKESAPLVKYGRAHAQSIVYGIKFNSVDGDVWRITPGYLTDQGSDYSAYNHAAWLAVGNGISIKGVAGAGRWSLVPPELRHQECAGLVIMEPSECYAWDGSASASNGDLGRKSIVIEDFDFDYMGPAADNHGIRVRSGAHNPGDASTWNAMHVAVTCRNFKLGLSGECVPGDYSTAHGGSGFSGDAYTWTFEDGLVYDCGSDGTIYSENNHNFYVAGRYIFLNGVRSVRTRSPKRGHAFKTRAANVIARGCVFAQSPLAVGSMLLQMADGGNLDATGCLFIHPTNPGNQRMIVHEVETDSGVPWYYGVDGHSLNITHNVFVSRTYTAIDYPTGAWPVFIRGAASAYASPLNGHPEWVTIRDNNGSNIIRPASQWISYDDGLNWATNNSSESYDASDSAWTKPGLLEYKRAAGPQTADLSVATKRLVYPHGWRDRADSLRGLG